MFQVSLGNTDDLLIIGTANSYNDGKWHRLDAARSQTKCSLKVDREILKMDSNSREDSISMQIQITYSIFVWLRCEDELKANTKRLQGRRVSERRGHPRVPKWTYIGPYDLWRIAHNRRACMIGCMNTYVAKRVCYNF